MERARDSLIECYQTVELILLDEPDDPLEGRAIQLSGHEMRVVADQPVPLNAAIKISADNWFALGEVCYCRRERSHYAIGLLLDQVVNGITQLHNLNRALTENRSARVPSPALVPKPPPMPVLIPVLAAL